MNFAPKLEQLKQISAKLDNAEMLKTVNKLKSYVRLEIISAEEIIEKRSGQLVAKSSDEQTSLFDLFSELSANIDQMSEYGAKNMGEQVAKSALQALENAVAEADIRVELSKQAIHLVKTIKLKEKSAKMLKAAFYKIQTEFGTEIFVGSDLSTSDTVLELNLDDNHKLDMAKAALNIFFEANVEVDLIVDAVKDAGTSLNDHDDGLPNYWPYCLVPGCDEMFSSRLEYYSHYFKITQTLSSPTGRFVSTNTLQPGIPTKVHL